MKRRRHGRALVVAGVAGVTGAVLLAGCGSDGPAGPPVAIVGDSITALIADDYADADVPFELTVRATNGATTAEMLEDARAIAGEEFDQAIINLGTNDAMKRDPVEDTISAYGEMIALFDGARCIHLTTLNEEVLSFSDPAVKERMLAINEHLRALAEEHDGIHLIDWNAALRELEGDDDDTRLLVDSVHPTDAGQAILRDLSVAALTTC
jgi:lysophospholipase L1-like esterase